MNEALRILLIDDDEDDMTLFFEAVSGINQQIDCQYFNIGELALKWLAETTHLPDYIFLDLNMPKMNGLEVLKAIKGQQHIKDIPVIVYSTSRNEAHRQEAKNLGAALYIIKPYRLIDLTAEIQSVLETLKR
jgi:CheY-like chemotaxis protein